MIFLFMVKHSILLNPASSLWWRCFLLESYVADFHTPRIWINNLTIFCIAIFVLFSLHSNNLGDNDLLQSLSLCWREQRSVIISYLVAFCTFVSACSVLPALHKSLVSSTCFQMVFFFFPGNILFTLYVASSTWSFSWCLPIRVSRNRELGFFFFSFDEKYFSCNYAAEFLTT